MLLLLLLDCQISRADNIRLISIEQEQFYRSFIPEGIPIHNNNLIFYDESVIPRIFQVFDRSATPGIYFTRQGLSANGEFPWSEPAGLISDNNNNINNQTSNNVIRFVNLSGPIFWWRLTYKDGTFKGFDWEYSPGTTFGEILLQKDSTGTFHTWEVRTRTKRKLNKNKESDGWNVQVYRPFPTEDDLATALQEKSITYHPPPARRLKVDSGHSKNAFIAEGWTVTLPSLPERQVIKLLDTTKFQPSIDRPFRIINNSGNNSGNNSSGNNDIIVEAPTNINQDFSIVPRNYMGWAIPVNKTSCMRCHEDAGHTVNIISNERRWRLRGNDGIWSFHPFDRDSLNTSTLKLSKELRAAGLIAHKDGKP